MKNSKHIVTLTLVALIAIISASAAGQNRERYGISAKAGGVNAVVGRVLIRRPEQQLALLTSTDNLVAGEVVTTTPSSNAEILLNPGSYLRLGEKSEFEFEDISLDHLRLHLTKGSAIIEATGVADMDLGIKVATAQGEFTIMRSGVYRIDVSPSYAELAVIKGRASYGPNKTDIAKGGKVITLNNGVATVAKLQKNKDAFDAWSKQRAELLAKANARLTSRAVYGYLANSRGWDSWMWGPTRFGVWTFSPRVNCYTFVPFSWGWSSPYGHYYGTYYWTGWGNGGCCNNRGGGQPTIVSGSHGPGSITPSGYPGVSGTPSPVIGTPMPKPGVGNTPSYEGTSPQRVRKPDQ